MGRFIIALGIVLGLCGQSWAKEQLRVDAIPYYGYMDYGSKTVKQNAHLAGIYGYFGYGLKHLLEAEIDYINQNRSDSDLEQWDTTLVYTNFSVPNWKFRVGGHYIASDDAGTDGGWYTITGAHYYVLNGWDLGADLYTSHYNDFTPELNVYQFTPHWGVPFARSANKALRSDLTGYYIRLDENLGLGKENFFSVEEKISIYSGLWSAAVFGWVGKQSFAVRNGGFAVFNLSEEHKNGYGAEIRYAFSKGSKEALTVRVSREEFEDFGTGSDTFALSVTLLLGISF